MGLGIQSLARKNWVDLEETTADQSVAVMCLPTRTMKTAGVTSPIKGTNTPGSQLAANSLDMTYT